MNDVMNAVLSGAIPSRDAFEEYFRRFHEEVESATEAALAGSVDEAGRETYDRLAESVDLGPTTEILDVGCGDGVFLERVIARKRSVRVSGIDLSDAEIARAAARLPKENVGSLRAGNAAEMRFQDGAFDAAFSHMVLMLIPDVDRVLREVRRVLRPNAPFALLIPRPGDEDDPVGELLRSIPGWVRERHPAFTPINPGDMRVWSAPKLTELLLETGFRTISIDDFTVSRPAGIDELLAMIWRRYYLGSLSADTRAHVVSRVREWAGNRNFTYREAMRIIIAR